MSEKFSRFFMVVYTDKREKLDISSFYYLWQTKTADIASKRTFENEADAKAYACELGAAHGIPCAFPGGAILDN